MNWGVQISRCGSRCRKFSRGGRRTEEAAECVSFHQPWQWPRFLAPPPPTPTSHFSLTLLQRFLWSCHRSCSLQINLTRNKKMQVSFQNFDIYCKSRQCKWAKCWNCNSCKFFVYIFWKRWKFKLSNINKGTQSPKIEQCKKVAKRRLVYSFKQFKLTQNSFMVVIYFNLAWTRNV